MLRSNEFENNPTAHHCYRSAGFHDVQNEPEYYHVMGQDWKCLEMEYDPDEVHLELQDTVQTFELTDSEEKYVDS